MQKYRGLRYLAIGLAVGLVGVPASAQASTTIIGVYSSMSTTLDKGTFTLTPPSSNSPGAWSYTSSKPSVATIVGNVATLHGAGITEITATQAASGSYASASRTTPLTVQRGTPTAPTWSNQSAQFSTGQYTIIPPTSVSTGTWTYTSSNPSIATVQGNTLYLNDGGVVTIHGIQSADVNWNQTSASMTFTSIAPVPTVGPFLNLSLPLYNISSVNLTAPTSTSSGPWVFTIDNPSVAALVGTTLTPLSAGTAIISAKQLPAGGFGSVTETMTLTISAATPNVGTFANMTVPFGPNLATIGFLTPPQSSSPGAWTFTSSDPTVATINGTSITYLKPGQTTISATQATSGTYGAYGPTTMVLTVQGTPTLVAPANIQKVFGDADSALPTLTSLSNGAFTYSTSDSSVVAVNGNSLHIVGAGTAVVTITQIATPIWQSASTGFSVTIFGTTPTIGTFAPFTITVGDAPSSILAPTSNSLGKWTFTSSNPAVATVADGKITAIAEGSATISATQNPAGQYGLSNTVSAVVTVKPKPVPVAVPTPAATPSPVVRPVVKPAVKPTTKAKSSSLKVTVGKGFITIKKPSSAVATISGHPAKEGKNLVAVGSHAVIIKEGTKVLYKKIVSVK